MSQSIGICGLNMAKTVIIMTTPMTNHDRFQRFKKMHPSWFGSMIQLLTPYVMTLQLRNSELWFLSPLCVVPLFVWRTRCHCKPGNVAKVHRTSLWQNVTPMPYVICAHLVLGSRIILRCSTCQQRKGTHESRSSHTSLAKERREIYEHFMHKSVPFSIHLVYSETSPFSIHLAYSDTFFSCSCHQKIIKPWWNESNIKKPQITTALLVLRSISTKLLGLAIFPKKIRVIPRWSFGITIRGCWHMLNT